MTGSQSPQEKQLRGIALSPGIAMGVVHRLENRLPDTPEYRVHGEQILVERQRFMTAANRSRDQYWQARQEIPKGGALVSEVSCLLDAHCMMLEDALLRKGILAFIDQGCNAEWAVRQYLERMVTKFNKVEDPYLQEKRMDVEQVCKRLLINLIHQPGQANELVQQPVILVAQDFSPADILLISQQQVVGLAMAEGGPTSHTAIFAKSFGLPAVGGVVELLEQVQPLDRLVVDGLLGRIWLHPTPELEQRYRLQQEGFVEFRNRLLTEPVRPATTLDGYTVSLQANIERVEEANQALRAGSEAVGLYRTDHLFFNRKGMLAEEEQYESYCRVLRIMEGRPVTFRTMDMPSCQQGTSQTPEGEVAGSALGMRGIRYGLRLGRRPLTGQFRALLRAASHGPLAILLPMVATRGELVEALQLLEQVRSDMVSEGILDVGLRVPVGIMVEVPAAALCARQLAPLVDFFSIGTNDLVQYTLAVDRVDQQVAEFYNPAHAAVLELIRLTVDAAHEAGIRVTVCGEMASDPRFVPLLLALQVDVFSISPMCLPMIRRLIQNLHLARAKEILQAALSGSPSAQILQQLEELVREHHGVCHASE
ncbi:MAG: phosphoenolpyruvate--protein phosphotransferase [Magnetococcales bacterium]|nr:phosphoenolpyruvate--protein phosphotransferase [Magnetococcales bacterium]NGZ27203.1 phosphoenolpyruvate--protein phosphotransferase [Magnetococcales bacterium]